MLRRLALPSLALAAAVVAGCGSSDKPKAPPGVPQKTFEQRDAAKLGQGAGTVGEDNNWITHRAFLTIRTAFASSLAATPPLD